MHERLEDKCDIMRAILLHRWIDLVWLQVEFGAKWNNIAWILVIDTKALDVIMWKLGSGFPKPDWHRLGAAW